MVNVWEHLNAAQEAQHFCQIHGVPAGATVLVDATGDYAEQVGLRGVPFNLVVGEDGIVVAAGATTPVEVMETLSALLGDTDEDTDLETDADEDEEEAAAV